MLYSKILCMIHFAGWSRPSFCILRFAISACQTGFPVIKNHGKVSTPFEGLGAGPCRDWKDARPRTRSRFSQEATIGTYDTRTIARNRLSLIDKN